MSTDKHTPGPWRAIRNEVHVGTRRICAYVGAGVSLNLGAAYERECANARLIAAAPDMLLALRRAVLALAFAAETSPAMRDDYEDVSKAIAKATGASHG